MADAALAAADPLAWTDAEHQLTFGAAVPGAQPDGSGRWTLRWRGPALMGVLNVTPDSFSDGGVHRDAAAAVAAGVALWREGATFIDVGGESSRPGAEGVPAAQELRRVLPVVEGLSAAGIRVSIDTVKAEVAREAIAAGACLINDIGGLDDAAMRAVCVEAQRPAVLMHMQGRPGTMQRAPRYDDVVGEVESYLLAHAHRALAEGVPSLAIDPGIGFGKTVEHNLALIRAGSRLAGHGFPLLVGASRKSMIDRLVGGAGPLQRLPGTLSLHLEAARQGAALLRVHDVAEHVQALTVEAALTRAAAGERGSTGG